MKIKKKRKVPKFHQLAETECGVCCCVMLLRYYRSNEPYTKIQDELFVGRDGLSMKQIIDFFQQRNFDSKVVRINRIEEVRKEAFPLIGFVDQNHYIVVEKYKRGKVIINDPAKGRAKIGPEEFKKRFMGVAVLLRPNKQYKPVRKRRKSPWWHVIGSLRDKKALLASIFVLMAGIYYLMLKVPLWIQEVIDQVIVSQDKGDVVKYYGVATLALLFYAMLLLLRCSRVIALNVCLGHKLEADTFYKLIRLPYRFFESRNSGDIFQRLSSASAVKEMLSNQLIGGILDIGSMCVLGVYMFHKSVLLSIVALSVWGINLLGLLLLRPRIAQRTDDEVAERAKAQSLQIETLYSINAVKVSAFEEMIYARWKELYDAIILKFKKRVWATNLNAIISGTIQLFGPLMVLLIGVMEQLEGRMTIGEVIAFYSIVSSFFGFSNSIASMFSQVVMMNTYMERLNEIWQKKELDLHGGIRDFEIDGGIVLDNVSFRYSMNSKPALENVSIEVKPGQKVALVGTSGSGKSTLSKLMLGLYEPTEGKVYFDNMEASTLNRQDLSRQIGIVPQDSMLFNKTIYDNIKMNSGCSTEMVEEAAKVACIHDEIMQMPMKYHTLISEMGINLSGGQRQRILLARAFVNEPKILLLDEATSSLDNINERKIMDYLQKKGCTRVVIAHRLSTIVDSDIIYVLNNGRVIASGLHKDLLHSCLEYRWLYEKEAEDIA